MGSDDKDGFRLKLFSLVWERPATEVAAELGISDVALGKLCRRLQVPKPPRGYWAKVKAGRIPRQPVLKAFSTQVEKRRKIQAKPQVLVRLSAGQKRLLKESLAELASAGSDVSGCTMTEHGIKHIDGSVAAQVLIFIQAQFEDWLEKTAPSSNAQNGRVQILRALVDKLLPLAQHQVLVFETKAAARRNAESEHAVFVRLTPDRQHRIAELWRLVREQRLLYASAPLTEFDHAFPVTFLHQPDRHANATGELCVGTSSLWVRFSMWDYLDSAQVETAELPLDRLLQPELLSGRTVEAPQALDPARLKPYSKRLRALRDVQAAYELISESVYGLDESIPDDHLALVERLWFGETGEAPFSTARRALEKVSSDLEAWERRLEAEQSELAQTIVGVQIGDDLVSVDRGKMVRIRVESASVYLLDDGILFQFRGRRYRKDGLPGKLDHTIYLHVNSDWED